MVFMKMSRIILYAAPALLLGLVLFSCKKKDEPPVPTTEPSVSADVRIVATVNGRTPIT